MVGVVSAAELIVLAQDVHVLTTLLAPGLSDHGIIDTHELLEVDQVDEASVSFGIEELEQVLLLISAQPHIKFLQGIEELFHSHVDGLIEAALLNAKELQHADVLGAQATTDGLEEVERPMLRVIDSLDAVGVGHGVCELEVAHLAVSVAVEDGAQVTDIGLRALVAARQLLNEREQLGLINEI